MSGELRPDTVSRILTTRRKFTAADEAIYGSRTFGPDREASAVETLVRARHDYQEALDQGERELGLQT